MAANLFSARKFGVTFNCHRSHAHARRAAAFNRPEIDGTQINVAALKYGIASIIQLTVVGPAVGELGAWRLDGQVDSRRRQRCDAICVRACAHPANAQPE